MDDKIQVKKRKKLIKIDVKSIATNARKNIFGIFNSIIIFSIEY